MEKKTYIIGTKGAEIWNNLDEFDSVEEAVAALDTGNYDGEEGWDDADGRMECAVIGLKVEIDPTIAIDGDDLICRMSEYAQQECGEVAEQFLDGLHNNEIGDLTEAVRQTINCWLNRHGLKPTFFQVEEVATYKEEKAKTVNAI